MRKALFVFAAAAVATGAAAASAGTTSLEPGALARAKVIRAEVEARYRLMPGRKRAVTEATTTGVVASLTLLSSPLEPPRVVPADNGIYYALCSVRATCPYPVRSRSWADAAFQPRRQALELAIRTFVETSASLVVVALPTARPVWVVFERDDLVTGVDTAAVHAQLLADPRIVDTPLRDIVERLTHPRLFVPLGLVPVSPMGVTVLAHRLPGPGTAHRGRD